MAISLKIKGCVAFISTFVVIVLADDGYPEWPDNAWQAQMYMYAKVFRMSKLICKDATLKLRQATKVTEKYKKMLSYELGTISAGIQDIFKHMLEVYRKYSNLSEYRSNEYSIRDVFNAYHIVKGDFNEIRMARNMYYDIVEKHRKRNERIETIKNKWKDLIANIGVQGKRRSGMVDANSPWVPYNRSTMDMKEKELEEEYKKSLRYKKWSEKWDNFIPEVEGVDIDEAAIPKF